MQERSKKTRELILEAAYRVFVREGFEGAQIDTIAREAGRTKGAVYAHFENKEHLFLSLLEQLTSRAAQHVDELVAKESDPARFMAALREGLTELRDPAGAVLILEFKLYALRHPEAAQRLRTAYRRIHEPEAKSGVFAHFADRGESRVASRLTALWTIVSAIALDMNFDPQTMSRREARLVLGEVIDGLFPTGAPKRTSKKGRPE